MANGQLGTVIRYLRQMVGTGEAGDRTDGQLLEGFAGRHEAAAFEALVRRHAPLVWSVCRRILRDEHEAEDVFQATFLVLVKKAPTLDGRGSIGNWLYTVAYHLALKARMKTARQRTGENEAADMVQSDSTADGLEELHGVLDEELHRLPAKYRGPLVLCYLQGKTNEEAARELGCPAGSISRHLTRARDLLRERLMHRGVALAPAVLTPILAESANAAVPASVIQATVQAGLMYSTGQAVAGALSAEAVSLAEGLLKAASVAPWKIAAAVLLTVGLLGTGAGVLVFRSRIDTPPPTPVVQPLLPSDGGLAATVDRQVRDWQPTPDERRMGRIGWATDLRHARHLALLHNRPIFLYVHGRGMALGRCDGGASHMRASALSNPRVIDLLNHCFVPVYLNTADYDKEGTVPAEERKELERTTREIFQAKLQFGSQWAVILAPDGEPLFGMHGCTAATARKMIGLLEWYAAECAGNEGDPVVAPRPQNPPPAASPDALVLHLTARYMQRRGTELVPFAIKPGDDNAGAWRTCPAESWIVLDRAAWTQLLPPDEARAGATWMVDSEVAHSLLQHFYPATEDNNLARNRIDRGELRATVVMVRPDRVRVRIDGQLRMKHRFTSVRDDDRFVDAGVLGYLDYDPVTRSIRAVRLLAPHATYGPDAFAVAVRSLP